MTNTNTAGSGVPATVAKDIYKEFHPFAYHPEVSVVYANYINRSGKLTNIPPEAEIGGVVNLGAQRFCKEFLIGEFNKTFFDLPVDEAIEQHARLIRAMLGKDFNDQRLRQLHNLGFLPLRIKTLPEGTITPYGVATITVVSTRVGFQWLTNAIETVMSCEISGVSTSCTTATAYLKVFHEFAEKTGLDPEFVPFQGHDFSMRGMIFGREGAYLSGLGHLASGLCGTDTIGSVVLAEKFYNANIEKELVGCSVDATEHSVTCSWIEEGEEEFIQYLMDKASPQGILSIVADTWDFWNLITNILPRLKDKIMNRDGTVVIRPDSGDPVEILCGTGSNAISFTGHKYATTYDKFIECAVEELDEKFREELDKDCTNPICDWSELYEFEGKLYEIVYTPDLNRHDKTYYYVDNWGDDKSKCVITEIEQTPESKGLIECLWDIFGGTYTTGSDGKQYKLLDEHIGAIYGDSITLERQREILQRLMDKGFASKVVLGIGSYTYQYVTRDTHGSAVKATSVIKDGRRVAIFKDPKTDRKKKSAKGLLYVGKREDGTIYMEDDVSEEREQEGMLETIFEDGKMIKETSLQEIRDLIKTQI